MENVHLVPEEEEDDLYTGYNDYNPTFDSEVQKYLDLRHAFYELAFASSFSCPCRTFTTMWAFSRPSGQVMAEDHQ